MSVEGLGMSPDLSICACQKPNSLIMVIRAQRLFRNPIHWSKEHYDCCRCFQPSLVVETPIKVSNMLVIGSAYRILQLSHPLQPIKDNFITVYECTSEGCNVKTWNLRRNVFSISVVFFIGARIPVELEEGCFVPKLRLSSTMWQFAKAKI